MVVTYWERVTVYLLIKSQYFIGEESLCCGLQKSVLAIFFLLPLHETGRLDRAGAG